ncbi:SIR2 family protein [Halocynthiibacter styelae]|uniref:SIR2 family protein n=1 Tax=Halocynthiibacter styelae TaxID=2761955 RepID=A0A8J7J3P9_9RHOB|nr:SIR2 family protein [Paenihalocynthiibacter styelae]MBI1492690.1 SIR2 family protein [Paenihalocynthiibacter styelae]
MSEQAIDTAEQFEKALNSPKQTWLLCAGISYPANIPLMIPLTKRVLDLARIEKFLGNDEVLTVIDAIEGDIDEDAHIEIFLTHLADLISMSVRARDNNAQVAANKVSYDTLRTLHNGLLELISTTIRWGYRAAWKDDPELVGTPEEPIVKIDEHLNFVDAIFQKNQAGLENIRGTIEFFTTNYDTLIEDALALKQVPYDDGFIGGGVGFWAGYDVAEHRSTKARVVKLHGSIDWVAPEHDASQLFRTRFNDKYPKAENAVVIYPQSTKYINTQLDPFSALFNRFRQNLSDGAERILLICGYSFGDEHINEDIIYAMSKKDSRLTMVAFAQENGGLPEQLETWRKLSWGERIYIASDKGLYRGSAGPFWEVDGGRSWWTFAGVTDLLSNGLPQDIEEALK